MLEKKARKESKKVKDKWPKRRREIDNNRKRGIKSNQIKQIKSNCNLTNAIK